MGLEFVATRSPAQASHTAVLGSFIGYRAMGNTINKVFAAVGIKTFADLKAATPNELKTFLVDNAHYDQVMLFRENPLAPVKIMC